MAVAVYNGFFSVNQFRNNANMNQGKNVLNGYAYFAKANFAIGQIAGNFNLIPTAANILNDPDAVDNVMPNAAGQSPIGGSMAEVF